MRGQVHFPDQESCYAGWFCLIRVSSPQGVPRIAWRVESGALLDLEVAPRQKSYGGLAMPLVPETMREEDVLEASEAVALLGRRWKSQIRRRRHRCHSRRRQHPGDLEGPWNGPCKCQAADGLRPPGANLRRVPGQVLSGCGCLRALATT